MATLLNVPLVNGLQKTLDAQLDAGTTASVTLNNTTNIQAPGVFVVNRIDANGNEKSASDREFIKFTGVSGNTLTGLTRNADGGSSDQDHAVGSIVEFVADVVWAQALVDVIETEHNSDGTHASTIVKTTATQTLTNKTLTSPVIDTQVTGTAILDEDDMASDSDVQLATQQSIKAYVDSKATSDGWLTADAMTYASSTTVTISGNVTAKYPVGSVVKFDQTTTKYFYVVSSSYSEPNTTLTLTGGSDYAVANAKITDPYYSYVNTPQGFPVFFNYTPMGTGFSTKTSDVGRFCINGRLVTVWLYIQGTSNATTFTASLPVASKKRCQGPIKFRDNGSASSTFGLYDFNTDGSGTVYFYTSPAGAGWANTNAKGNEHTTIVYEMN